MQLLTSFTEIFSSVLVVHLGRFLNSLHISFSPVLSSDGVNLMGSISIVHRCGCFEGKMESNEYLCPLKNGLKQSAKDLTSNIVNICYFFCVLRLLIVCCCTTCIQSSYMEFFLLALSIVKHTWSYRCCCITFFRQMKSNKVIFCVMEFNCFDCILE